MVNLSSDKELQQLNRLLYKATDSLMEYELSLRQLKVSKQRRHITQLLICPACGKPWPHIDDITSSYY